MSDKLLGTLLDPTQIRPTKEGYESLYEQLEFGRFNSVHTGAAPSLFQEMIASEGQSRFVMPQGTYVMGDHSLQVFVNGQLMRSGADNDYMEIDNRTIEFHFGLDKDDIVVCRVNGGKSGPSLHENYRATADQTVFHLASSYTTGNHSLLVFINGAYQTIEEDYHEVDGKTVRFLEPLEEEDLVTFRVEGLPSIETKYGDTHINRLYSGGGELLREEIIGDGVHVIKEYHRGADGKPEKMTIRNGGHIITRTYVWDGFRCTDIFEEIKEGS